MAHHRGLDLTSSPSRPVRRAAALALAVAPLGVPVVVLWWLLAPRVEARSGPQGPAFVDPQPEAFIAADLLLCGLGLAAGLLTGWLAERRTRADARVVLPALLGLVVGAGVAAALSWQVGVRLDDREQARAALRDPAPTAVVELPLQLRSRAALLGWPAGAAVLFTWGAVARSARSRPEGEDALGAPVPGDGPAG